MAGGEVPWTVCDAFRVLASVLADNADAISLMLSQGCVVTHQWHLVRSVLFLEKRDLSLLQVGASVLTDRPQARYPLIPARDALLSQ